MGAACSKRARPGGKPHRLRQATHAAASVRTGPPPQPGKTNANLRAVRAYETGCPIPSAAWRKVVASTILKDHAMTPPRQRRITDIAIWCLLRLRRRTRPARDTSGFATIRDLHHLSATAPRPGRRGSIEPRRRRRGLASGSQRRRPGHTTVTHPEALEVASLLLLRLDRRRPQQADDDFFLQRFTPLFAPSAVVEDQNRGSSRR